MVRSVNKTTECNLCIHGVRLALKVNTQGQKVTSPGATTFYLTPITYVSRAQGCIVLC